MRQAEMLTLFDYNYWGNHQILDHATRVTEEQFRAPAAITVRGLRETLVHTLDVEWSWRLRLQGEPPELWQRELAEDDYPTVAALAERWQQDEADMRAWLASLSDADLDATLDLGLRDRYPLWYFLMHIIQHSAQQRADAATLLTHYGASPGELEFLGFADWRSSRAFEAGTT